MSPKKNNNGAELGDKALKAKRSLEAFDFETEGITKRLRTVRKILQQTIKKEKSLMKIFNPKNQTKRRALMHDLPERLEFFVKSLRFYIDFTVSPARGGNDQDMEGVIVYGTNRTLCFEPCIFPNKSNVRGCYRCERIGRCDGLEDKPLLKFLVNRHGAIKSDKFEDKWWLQQEKEEKENKKALAEIHFRAVEHIWRGALDWTNENLLP